MWGEVIGGIGGALVSGLFNSSSQNAALAAQESMFNRNVELQREFAQNGVRWKVEDAKAAGLHPLFALGANTVGFSPIQVFPQESATLDFAQVGQNIGGAIERSLTGEERLETRLLKAQVRRAEAEADLVTNQAVASSLAVHSATNPPFPSAMSGSSGQSGAAGRLVDIRPGTREGDMVMGYEIEPVKIPAANAGSPGQEAGAFPDIRWARTATGFRPIPHPDVYQDTDIGTPDYLEFYARNRLLPTILPPGMATYNPPPRSYLPEGATGWRFHRQSGEYQPVFGNDPTTWERITMPKFARDEYWRYYRRQMEGR